jgi:hypothetical protein
MLKKMIWKGHNMNAICWAFYCKNDGENVDGGSFQVMICLFCYTNFVHVSNPSTKENKVL